MPLIRLALTFALPLFLVGCAGLLGTQPPAPVQGAQPKVKKTAPITAQQKPKRTNTKEIVKTEPFKGYSEIKAEPLAPSMPLSEPITIEQVPEPSLSSEPPTPPPAAEEALPAFEPLNTTTPLSAAASALVSAANQNSQAGDLEAASASLERAIRIEPRNASLFYKLALLRLKQSKPILAEDLAKKSALLASTDNTLKKHCWLLIAHARELQKNFSGAKEAREKADSF